MEQQAKQALLYGMAQFINSVRYNFGENTEEVIEVLTNTLSIMPAHSMFTREQIKRLVTIQVTYIDTLAQLLVEIKQPVFNPLLN